MARQIERTVVMDTEPLPADGGWRWDPRAYVRGTEEFYVRTAEELAKAGYDVVVRYDGEFVSHNSVRYVPRGTVLGFGHHLLACNQPPNYKIENGSNVRTAIWWTNKYGQTYSLSESVFGFDDHIVLSEFHRSIFGYDHAVVIGHGCDVEKYTSEPKQKYAFYSSSPDRGLDFLKGIWPAIQEQTGCELIHTQGNTPDEMVTRLYKRAKYWVHPGLGVELFCLSALKAQVAGCIPIVVPHMALGETVKYGVKTDLFKFQEKAIETIKANDIEVPTLTWPTWTSETKKIAALFKE